MTPHFDTHLNGMKLSDLKDETEKRLHSLRDKTVEASKAAARGVGELAQKDPWPVIGFFAILAAIFGFIIGRKISRH